MIYVLIGTKAQLIKMFPIMLRLQEAGIPYRYIDTVQHGPLCEKLRTRLGLSEPSHFLAKRGTQVESSGQALRWIIHVLWQGLRRRKSLFPEKGIVLVHGDTFSTLIGLILGRLAGQKIGHVEAGERTYKLTRPFPEEIIRRIVDRYSHLLLACGDQQTRNLEQAKVRGKIVNLRHNTLVDAVAAVAGETPPQGTTPSKDHVMVSIHRFETISSRQRMTFLVDALEILAKTEHVIFGLHPPTRNKMIEFGLLKRLETLPNLQLRGLFDYPDFIRTLSDSMYIITDGGGPQEESFFLGKPCLLARSETERAHPNVCMAEWDLEKVRWFNAHHAQFKRPPLSAVDSPSTKATESIIDFLKHVPA